MATLSENIEQTIHDFDSIKDSIEQKGVSVPVGTPTSGYAEKIGQIPTGIVPEGKIEITQNGNDIDIAQYATADVKVYDYQRFLNSFIAGDMEYVTFDGELVPHRAFQFKRNLREVYLPNAIYIGAEAFYNIGGISASAWDPETQDAFTELRLKKVEAPNVITIDNNAFLNSTIEEFIHGGNLVFIGEHAFQACGITSFKLSPSVVSIGSHAFSDIPVLNVDMTDFTIEDDPPRGPVGMAGSFDPTNQNLKFYFSSQEVIDKFSDTSSGYDWPVFSSHFVLGDPPSRSDER